MIILKDGVVVVGITVLVFLFILLCSFKKATSVSHFTFFTDLATHSIQLSDQWTGTFVNI